MTVLSKVAILGASDNPDRSSNMLVKRLHLKGHEVFPVHPALTTLDGLPVYPNLAALPKGIDVLSVYLGPERSTALAAALAACGIPKIIFNPGAENPALEHQLEAKGFQVQEACSLVLSSLDQL